VPMTSDPSLIGRVRAGAAAATDDQDGSAALPAAPALSVFRDAVSEAEEARLVADADRWLRRKAYEGGHFDRVITNYREVQKPVRSFSKTSRAALERLIGHAFPEGTPLLPVHVLDLAADGHISRHVDHVDYSGEAIVGLSLLSDALMTLHYEPDAARSGRGMSDAQGNGDTGEALALPSLPLRLPRRSLDILRGDARYLWSHAVALEDSPKDDAEPRGRRLAFILRDALPES
jgi:hypothetical protein